MLSFLIEPRGDARWDRVIRATGVAALVGVPLIELFPRLVPLVWLAVLTIPASSPLSPILPASFEPLIMEAAKYERAIWVTLVALGVHLYMEYLNWHLYSWVLSHRLFATVREKAWVRRSVTEFSRFPFATVVFFAFTPMPFWVIRCVAILHGYPIGPFVVATAVGRMPRIFLYAWLGAALRVPTVVLVGVIFGTAAFVIAGRIVRGKRLLPEWYPPTEGSVSESTSYPR